MAGESSLVIHGCVPPGRPGQGHPEDDNSLASAPRGAGPVTQATGLRPALLREGHQGLSPTPRFAGGPGSPCGVHTKDFCLGNVSPPPPPLL